jgi:hypothetical protein
MTSARCVVVAIYSDEKPHVLAANLHTEELVVHLGVRPVVLELNGFTATWDLLTPVGTGRFEIRNGGEPWLTQVFPPEPSDSSLDPN